MLPILNTLRIVNLGGIIAETNITRVIILTIATITTMVVNHGEESVIFVGKKFVALVSIQIISNGKEKNSRDEIENFVEIKANTIYF